MSSLGTSIFRRLLMERNGSYGRKQKPAPDCSENAAPHWNEKPVTNSVCAQPLQITNYQFPIISPLPLHTHADLNIPLRILQNRSMW